MQARNFYLGHQSRLARGTCRRRAGAPAVPPTGFHNPKLIRIDANLEYLRIAKGSEAMRRRRQSGLSRMKKTTAYPRFTEQSLRSVILGFTLCTGGSSSFECSSVSSVTEAQTIARWKRCRWLNLRFSTMCQEQASCTVAATQRHRRQARTITVSTSKTNRKRQQSELRLPRRRLNPPRTRQPERRRGYVLRRTLARIHSPGWGAAGKLSCS